MAAIEAKLLFLVGSMAVVSTVGIATAITAMARGKKGGSEKGTRPKPKRELARKKDPQQPNGGNFGVDLTSDITPDGNKFKSSYDPPHGGRQDDSVMERGLLVSGFDSQGSRVRLTIPKRDLDDHKWGVTIGRDGTLADYEVRDSERFVSRRHFRLRWNKDVLHYQIEDLGSESGTYVNDRKLTAFQAENIQMNSEIRIGRLKLNLSLS